MVKVRENMAGWIMSEHGVPESKLVVVEQVEDYIDPKGVRCSRWKCKCSCGNPQDLFVVGRNIRSGSTLSCGCKSKESSAETWRKNIDKIKDALRKENKVDLSGDYGIGWTLNTNREFYFDLEDYDKIKDYCWVESVSQTGYCALVAHVPDTYSKTIRMSDLLGFKTYDHTNRNPLDNRKGNFRKATHQENIRNSSKPKNNTSGFIGVSRNKTDGKWRAYIKVDYKQISLGKFTDKTDAIKARLEAEKKYFGRFAPQRHLFDEYEIEDFEEDEVNG